MDPTLLLVAATAAFLVTHFVPSTPLRATLVQAVGERVYVALYVLVAFATLGWMVYAYVRTPVEPLWPGLRLLPAIVMPFALVLLACGLLSRNPTAIGQERALKAAEPARGILRVTRHPVMWGLMLWAGAHVLARGDVRGLVFFGGFFALAALGTVLLDARKARTLGDDWMRFVAVTSNVPFVAIAQGRNRLRAGEIGLMKPAIGLVLYAVFLVLHGWLFDARPY